MATTNIAIACQGGGSHAAYPAGALPVLLPQFANEQLARLPAVQGGAGDGERLNLVGISGTSGGAITALLAWYGFVAGGPAVAAQKLAAFWEANSTQWIGEELCNGGLVRWANALPYDLKLSPYAAPLRELEVFTTQVWPSYASMMGGLNRWIRPEFFVLGDLIAPHVDFAVIAALGEFCSIPFEVRRWRAADLESRMHERGAARAEELEATRQRLQQRIRYKLGAATRLQHAMDFAGVPAEALLRVVFDQWKEPPCGFDAARLDALSTAVLGLTRTIPQLLVGAVQIDNGAFTAFSSERAPEDGGISLDAVLASAALPWLFRAQQVRQYDPERNVEHTHAYWDGLFSQNPPIRNFMSGVIDDAKKPDGIWVVQINPDDFHVEAARRRGAHDALSGNEIWHTRDALSGNLSLNQEVAFVEAINRRIDEGGATADKHIKVDRIVMDAHAVALDLPPGVPLGVASKFDRNAQLKDALVRHGAAQATRFLALRSHVEQVSGSFGAMMEQLSAPPAMQTPDLLARAVAGGGEEPGVREAQLVVDGITVHRQVRAEGAEQPLASVHWHTRGARLDGSEVRIEGDAGLFAEGSAGEAWRLGAISVTAPPGAHA